MPPVSCSALPFIMRETYTDWSSPTGTVTLQNTSVDLRPGALTQDYKTAFAYGPIEIANLVSGSVNTVWRIRTVSASLSSSIAISRASGSDEIFSAESTLFTFTHNESGSINEVDLGFGTDGRAVVAAERVDDLDVPKIWLYWFNPFLSNFVFQEFEANATTPRIILDNPEDIGNSDLLLFYVNRATGEVFYRQQRDQYNTPYLVPTPGSVFLDGTVISNSITYLSGSVYLLGFGSASVIDASIEGWFVGSGSNISGVGTASLFAEQIFSMPFTGTINGEYTGVFSGSWDDNITITSGSNLSGSFAGFLSGAFSYDITNSVTGVVGRTETGMFGPYLQSWGSFRATASADLLTGSIILTGSSAFLSGDVVSTQWAGTATGSFVVEYTNGMFSGSTSQFNQLYLEDAVKLRDSRVAVFYSRRDPTTDIWQVGRFETVLYPRSADSDRLSTNVTFLTGSLRDVLLQYSQTGSLTTDVFMFESTSVQIFSGSRRDVLLNLFQTGSITNDIFVFSNSGSVHIFSGSRLDVIINHTMFFPDVLTSASVTLSTGSLNTIVIDHTMFFLDTLPSASVTLITGSLIIP